jgi:hypothetical protein
VNNQLARAAAEAGTATRYTGIAEAHGAYQHDAGLAVRSMPANWHELTPQRICGLRTMHAACLAHLDELARLIAQRDGYADPRQDYLRELTEGDEPGVALNGWGSKR